MSQRITKTAAVISPMAGFIGDINPTRFRLFKAFAGGRLMLDKKELRRLARLHRLARQIAASLPAEIYSAHALRWMSTPTGCPNGSTTAAFSPRARSGACEIARARSVMLGIGSELLAQKSAVLQDRMIASSMSNEAAGSPQPEATRPEDPHRRFPLLSLPSSERSQS